MHIREVISQADHQALCEYLVTIEQKYETIYRNGKSNNFFMELTNSEIDIMLLRTSMMVAMGKR